MRPEISIVVPVLNEERGLLRFLRSLSDLSVLEVILVDGGSRDQTPTILKSWLHEPAPDPTRDVSPKHPRRSFITAKTGRGRQMNAGAAVATGTILLFLHADSILPHPASSWIHEIMTAFSHSNVVGGASCLQIASDSRFLKGVAMAANLRSRFLGLPYGDQGIFVRRDVFIKLNGYPDWPLMEDVDFVRRLKKRGKIVLLKTPLTTSARRWNAGAVTRSLRNVILLTLYFIGVCPTRLARWYH